MVQSVVIDRVSDGDNASSSDVGDGMICRPVEGLTLADDDEGGLKTIILFDTSKLAFVFQS